MHEPSGATQATQAAQAPQAAKPGKPSPLHAGHVTSAIPDMTVANIRKGLLLARNMYRNSSPTAPMFVCDALFEGLSLQEFAMRLVLGQHYKRHCKSQVQRAAAAHFQATGGLPETPAALTMASVSTVLRTPSLALPPAAYVGAAYGRMDFAHGVDSMMAMTGGVVTVVDGTVVPPSTIISPDSRSTLYVLTRMTQ